MTYVPTCAERVIGSSAVHGTGPKRTVYLDQSTLSSAYRARSLGRDGETYGVYAPLAPYVERVAHEANLRLSIVHLLELAKRPDVA